MSSSVIGVRPENAIYSGVWVNWSYGSIRGATLTLNHRDAGFLSAFSALFVSIVGRSFWRLFCYVMHARLSTSKPQDGLYHQRQVVLRNAATDVIGLQYFAELAWNWRNRASKMWTRLLPLSISTAMITAAFHAASILSSQVCWSNFPLCATSCTAFYQFSIPEAA